MKKIIFLSASQIFFLLCYSQKNDISDFEAFVAKQNAGMISAYEKKDTSGYLLEMKILLHAYENQTDNLQKNYKSVIENAYYNLACTYSLSNDPQNALLALKQSIQYGFNNYNHVLKDSDLEILRGNKAFSAILNGLKQTGDYLYILQQSGAYEITSENAIPTITYQDADHADLVALKNKYRLDSIAGSGSDVLQVINLMHWIHNLIPHDGNHPNPAIKNMSAMISECKQNARGLNCRGLAIILNECYLAMGFKSRFITCLPKDSLGVDPDCHVINSVYIPSLEKWVWMDPTNDAYVMNDTGDLQSIEEVRDALRNGAPLILNPSANWNNSYTKTKEEYLYDYMAKNLYMLQCIVRNEFDAETLKKGSEYAYITLVPPDYFKREAFKESTNEETNCRYRFYQTTNNELFWAKPASK